MALCAVLVVSDICFVYIYKKTYLLFIYIVCTSYIQCVISLVDLSTCHCVCVGVCVGGGEGYVSIANNLRADNPHSLRYVCVGMGCLITKDYSELGVYMDEGRQLSQLSVKITL
jgi:hypothetical protein